MVTGRRRLAAGSGRLQRAVDRAFDHIIAW